MVKQPEPSRLRVVSSEPDPEDQGPVLALCKVCEADTGTATNTWLDGLQSPALDDRLRMTGGKRVRICAHCMARGKVTTL